MTKKPHKKVDITELFRQGDAIDRAIRKGVRDALERHRRLGEKVVVWKDGKIELVLPDPIPEDQD